MLRLAEVRKKRNMTQAELARAVGIEICEGYGWEVSPDGEGGFVWDLEIVEEW